MKRPRRRMIIKVIGLLMLGAVINVAVAWGLAAYVPIQYLHHFERFKAEVVAHVGVAKSFGSEYAWIRTWRSQLPLPKFHLPVHDLRDRGLTMPQDIVDEHYRAGVERRGWPFLGMCWWHTPALNAEALRAGGGSFRPIVVPQVIHGIELPSNDHQISLQQRNSPAWRLPVRGGVSTRVLPLQPLWPGFMINTIFYAALCWLMLLAPFALRRYLRLRRNLCPACAYPIGSSPVCTECGAAVGQRSQKHIAPGMPGAM